MAKRAGLGSDKQLPKGISVNGIATDENGEPMALHPTFADWSTPEALLVVKQWRRDGCTIQSVAKNIGVDRSTLYNWAKKSADFKEAMTMGHAEAVAMIESRFFANAARSKRTVDQINWLRYNHRSKYYEEAPREAKVVKDEGTGVEKLLERLDEQLAPEDPSANPLDKTLLPETDDE